METKSNRGKPSNSIDAKPQKPRWPPNLQAVLLPSMSIDKRCPALPCHDIEVSSSPNCQVKHCHHSTPIQQQQTTTLNFSN